MSKVNRAKSPLFFPLESLETWLEKFSNGLDKFLNGLERLETRLDSSLDPRSFWELRIENQVSSIELREPVNLHLSCGLVYKVFWTQNIKLNCSFVRCHKHHRSWWNGVAELYISVDLLSGTMAAKLQNSVDLLSGTTATKLQNLADLLCGTMTAEPQNSVDLRCGTKATKLNNLVWCRCHESHTLSKDSDEPCFIQSKILLSMFYLPTSVDLQQSLKDEWWKTKSKLK